MRTLFRFIGWACIAATCFVLVFALFVHQEPMNIAHGLVFLVGTITAVLYFAMSSFGSVDESQTYSNDLLDDHLTN